MKGRWTRGEDAWLRPKVLGFQEDNIAPTWTELARCLGRSEDAVRNRWVGVLDPTLKMGSWSENEVDLLRGKMETQTLRRAPQWSAIARDLGRPRTSVMKKWEALSNTYQIGRWTPAEDILVEQTLQNPQKPVRNVWIYLGGELGRRPTAVRNRWHYVLKPLKKGHGMKKSVSFSCNV